jgi:hypothetical protein
LLTAIVKGCNSPLVVLGTVAIFGIVAIVKEVSYVEMTKGLVKLN